MKKIATLCLLLICICATAQYGRYQESSDNTILIGFLYIALTITLTVIGGDRTIGWGYSLIISLFCTPLVGIIAVFSTPRKEIISYQMKSIENQEEIISLLKKLETEKL